MEYKSKVAVVTGGSAGVGRATARELAKKGFSVGIIAREKERLKETEEELRELGVKTVGVSADVSNFDDVKNAADIIEGRLGDIGVWVNNAMVTVFSPVNKMTPEDYRRVTEVTYLGYVYGTMIALQKMFKQNEGTIIQVGSAVSYRAIPLQSAYSAAKFAIRGFTDSLRTELIYEKSNIHLTMVQLPALNTPQFDWCKSHMLQKIRPLSPIYQPELAADAIVWSVFHKRRELNVGYSSAATVFMNKVIPGFIDRKLADAGYNGQLTDELEDQARKHNLYEPVAGDYKAHGRFDKQARNQSPQLWLTMHLGELYLFGIALIIFAVVGSIVYFSP